MQHTKSLSNEKNVYQVALKALRNEEKLVWVYLQLKCAIGNAKH